MFEPAYLTLDGNGELRRRAQSAVERLACCRLCPRNCRVNRLADNNAVCHSGRYARVASYFPHHGEEDCLRGSRGSGTVFFSSCSLRCVFCQNHDISQGELGPPAPPERLAAILLELQDLGCHNINFVTPEHVVAQILEALPLAVAGGLRLPLVYNTSAYDSMESLALLDGIIDIYMPDFKFWDSEPALRYVKARDYPEAARRAIREMHRQVGPLVLDGNGLARRGVLVRHLLLPGEIAGTAAILRFLAEECSPDTYVNLMDQYRPAGWVSPTEYAEINRRITGAEYEAAVDAARRAGLRRVNTG